MAKDSRLVLLLWCLCIIQRFITAAKNFPQNNIMMIEIIDTKIFCSLLLGAMLVYAISPLRWSLLARLHKRWSKKFEDNLKTQFRSSEDEPDHDRCIRVSTTISSRYMIIPGLLVIATPIVLGVFFHRLLVAGLLPSAVLSGVQLAI